MGTTTGRIATLKARGNGGGAGFIGLVDQRYGQVRNLPDFARKSQLNYKCIKAIYEAHVAS